MSRTLRQPDASPGVLHHHGGDPDVAGDVLHTGGEGAMLAAIAIAGTGLGKIFPKSVAGASSGPKNIIEGAALKVGQTHDFVSKAGTPAVLFRTKNGVFAYSAVCTHQGCTVQFNSASQKLQCGCHGAVFDPFSDAKVVAGPTNTALPKIKVATEGAWIVEA